MSRTGSVAALRALVRAIDLPPSVAGANLPRRTDDWSGPAEEQLRRVCREQADRIRELEAEVERLQRQLSTRETVRAAMRRTA